MDPSVLKTASDATLVARALRADRDAQAELVKRYQKPVFGLCLNLVGRQDAEDLAQEALFRVLSKLDSFSGQSSLGTWIYRITTNICLTHLRRRTRSQRIDRELPHSPGQIVEPEAGSGVQTSETHRLLRAALERLPDEQRVILVLRDVRGLEYEQLAEILDIPVGTVRSRLFRARRALRDALQNPPRSSDA
ncbi:MAG: RNA polymerase sigma factor [Planctomycetota bacterium]|nr:MAG: RNA polymerase sigma factor [Planctomycetota bacterium]